MNKRKLAYAAPVLALMLGAGCANNAEMEKLRADLDSARQAANAASQQAAEARRVAQSAQSTADQARQRATAAQQSAQRAEAKADAAQQCCDANRERIDRVFRQSQLK